MNLLRIKEVFPDWPTNGAIFTALQSKPVPWADSNISLLLDTDYIGNYSGNKVISNLLENMINTDNEITAQKAATLASIIYSMYGAKWDKMWATQSFEYNPIENYNMVETMRGDEKITQYGHVNTRIDDMERTKTGTETDTPDITNTRTDNLTEAKTGNESHTYDISEARTDDLTSEITYNTDESKTGTETKTPDLSTTVNNSVYGFNSVSSVNANTDAKTETGTDELEYDLSNTKTGTETTDNTGTQTTVKTGTDTLGINTQVKNTGTETTVQTGTNETEYDITENEDNTVTNTESGRDIETRNYQLTRTGNIGVTTSQQMIESERNLWAMWDYFRAVVYPDIDRILTIETY